MLLVPSKKLDLDVKTWQLPERLCRLIVSHSSKDNPSPLPLPQLFQVDNDTDIQTQLHTVQHLDVHKHGKRKTAVLEIIISKKKLEL